ncbi:MAG: hypothetical protein WC047_02375 [Kiritimatiellales bacterium]
MAPAVENSTSQEKDIPEELRSVLISLGRGLGTVAVYGTEHPSVEQIIDQTFENLRIALRSRKSMAMGTFNGKLTIDDEPVTARDVPVRTLEKRLVAMKVSHLSLTKGLSRNELKKLLSALCSPTDTQMKETLSDAGLDHVEMTDVKYVTLRDGEIKTGKGGGSSDSDADATPPMKVSQIVAFLKGEAAGDTTGEVKKMLSDPERLGQMIMEAAAIRQTAVSIHDGESMADIVIGCLRRTYGGLRKEAEFQSLQGKVNLNKAMMLLEKNVLDKIHAALGAQHPEIDRRIFDAIREMEEEQKFDVLTAHYFDQRRKLDNAENKLVESIQTQGEEKAKEQLGSSGIPPKDWQKLLIKAGVSSPKNGSSGMGGNGLDLGALAVVLEKLEGLMQIESSDPAQVKTAVGVTRNGLNNYADRIESRIQELESQVKLHDRHAVTVEDHAEHLSREDLMVEVSKLTLSLLQPLTVVNASVEASLRYATQEVQKDLLDLAYESGKRMQSLTKRLMTLVGYPVLGK